MKMLEICLKLVGCKSKKGLSSSSSCYFEGKRLSVCVCVRISRVSETELGLGMDLCRWTRENPGLGSPVCLESGGGGRARAKPDILARGKEREEKTREEETLGNLIPVWIEPCSLVCVERVWFIIVKSHYC